MHFDDRRLQLESASELIQCPIHSIKPFALMLAPVYVLMKLNQKFVSVKAPLDFFTDDELQRLKNYEVFYLPTFARSSIRFQTAARLVKKTLTLRNDLFNLSSCELSGESFKIISALWGKSIRVESFFMSVFADELCTPFENSLMLNARENAVVLHDLGILLSGAVVFCALHLGYLDHHFLCSLRENIYRRTVEGDDWTKPQNEIDLITSDLLRLVSMDQALSLEVLNNIESEWARKLSARLEYLKKLNTNLLEESATIHGESGFVA